MRKFYDILFYRTYTFYAGKEKGAASSSAGIVGGLQASNVLVILMLSSFYFQKTWLLSMPVVIGVIALFQITTYFRYIYKDDNSVEKMADRWSMLEESKKWQLTVLCAVYILVSTLVFFGLAIYIGSLRN